MFLRSNQQPYTIQRYPKSETGSLQAWNAADEHILQYLNEEQIPCSGTVIYNDRFGFLTCALQEFAPIVVIDSKSQEKAIYKNAQTNQLDSANIQLAYPLDNFSKPIHLGIVKIPKSLDLFLLYLQQLTPHLSEDSKLVCAFMTKHFNTQLLDIANLFFEEVHQSKAWKKSRLLLLGKPKKTAPISILNEITLNDKESFKQYFGVFSAKHIDYATQFLMEHLSVPAEAEEVLDLASGNGVLAAAVRKTHQNCNLHLLDDFYLAVESSKLNLKDDKCFFHFNDSLEDFKSGFFDCVVSNPPFHFEYEVSIETALNLFLEVYRCLKPNGNFLLVANKHLNYKTHLQRLFEKVEIIAENEKFIIYNCQKNN